MDLPLRQSPPTWLTSLRHFAADIKIAHSIFALPFAASALLISDISRPSFLQGLLLVVAMIGARSFAMGMNRYLDGQIDAENPRTKERSIPAKRLTPKACLNWALFFGGIFVLAAFFLSTLAGWASIPLLGILAGYTLMKRISWLTHWYLGLCLGLAPMAVEIALTGDLTGKIVLLGLAVTFWTAGFDILYSAQDVAFDTRTNLKSVPVKFGVERALLLSRMCFVAMIAMLIFTGRLAGSGIFYYLGVGLVAVILAFEQFIVRDIQNAVVTGRINVAFFTANAYVSVLFLAAVALDKLAQ